jgi:hypothetical protein
LVMMAVRALSKKAETSATARVSRTAGMIMIKLRLCMMVYILNFWGNA